MFIEYYKSEILKGTVNLSWKSLDMRHIPCCYTATNHLCLRVWVQEGQLPPQVHLEYEIDLQALVLATLPDQSVRLCY